MRRIYLGGRVSRSALFRPMLCRDHPEQVASGRRRRESVGQTAGHPEMEAIAWRRPTSSATTESRLKGKDTLEKS